MSNTLEVKTNNITTEMVSMNIFGKEEKNPYTYKQYKPVYRVIIKDDPFNCKLTTVCSITGLKLDKDYFNELFKKCRILVHINTPNIETAAFIENNYELYGKVNVPIGYNGGYQYHLFVRNSLGYKNNNMRPTEYGKGGQKLNKNNVAKVLEAALKAKRRKTDVVPEIVAQLFNTK